MKHKRSHLGMVTNERIDPMAHADQVAEQYKRMNTGYNKGRQIFTVGALTSYRYFLNDEAAQEALFSKDNISRLREKPSLEETSRLLLYHLTGAWSEAERNIAGKYARAVDHLYTQGVENEDASEYIERVGGIEKLLKEARNGQACEVDDDLIHETEDYGSEDEDEEEVAIQPEPIKDEIFDPENDLAIRLNRESLAKVLGPTIRMKEIFYLRCRKVGTLDEGEIRIQGQLFDPNSR